MTLINTITSTIESIPLIDDSLNLTSDDFSEEFTTTFFSQVIKQNNLSILNANKKLSDDGGITVTGQVDLWSYKGLDIALTFSTEEEQVIATIDGIFPADKIVTLPVISWIEIGNIGVKTTFSQPYNIVSFTYHASILFEGLGKGSIPVEITKLEGNLWQLDIAEGTNQNITGAQLVSLLSGNALNSFLPEPLVNALDGFQINGISTIFNTEENTVSYFATGITVTNGWDIAPKVSLKPGLNLALTLLNPTNEKRRQVVGTVSGTFDLNGTELPIFIEANLGTVNLWSFGIQPGEKVILPSFSNLLDLAGGQDFLNTLPTGLSNIPQIEIDTLQVDFDPDEKELSRLSFSIQTASTWVIIENYFEVFNLLVAFDIRNLTNSSSRTIFGKVHSLFRIGSVPVICTLEKTEDNPNWTIIGGLPPRKTISITQVAVGLFENKITLPEDIPDISFSVLQITVVPDSKIFSFSAKSANQWTIINQFAIDSFDLKFTRDSSLKANSITGNMALLNKK
jgi:hypothetical protein